MEGPPAVMEATPARAPRGAARFASGKAFTDSPHTAGAPAPTLPGLRRGRGGRAHSHAAPRSQPPGPDRTGPGRPRPAARPLGPVTHRRLTPCAASPPRRLPTGCRLSHRPAPPSCHWTDPAVRSCPFLRPRCDWLAHLLLFVPASITAK